MGDPGKEDIEAEEGANVDLLERPLSKLAAAMGGLSRDSDAWKDFAETFDEMARRDLKGGTYDIGVPQERWDYWMQVAMGGTAMITTFAALVYSMNERRWLQRRNVGVAPCKRDGDVALLARILTPFPRAACVDPPLSA
jgi:hypothetical protein